MLCLWSVQWALCSLTPTPHSKAEAGSTNYAASALPTAADRKLADLQHFMDVFASPSTLPPLSPDFDHHIDHAEDNTTSPPARAPYRLPVSWAESAALKTQVADLLSQGLILPYVARVLLVKKPDGKLCMCVDYRALSKTTVCDRFPFPHIEARTCCTSSQVQRCSSRRLISSKGFGKYGWTTMTKGKRRPSLHLDLSNFESSP